MVGKGITTETSAKPGARRRPVPWRSVVFPVLVAVAGLGTGLIGGFVVANNEISGVNAFVESLSGSSTSRLGSLGAAIPLGFAFAAGMVSTVNPCGFAMLPAYLGMYLGNNDPKTASATMPRRLLKAVQVGGVVTVGFALLFGITGIIITAGARSVVDIFPWVGLTVGILLTLAGAWLVRGGTLYTSLGERAAARIGNPGQVSNRGFFLFGVSYGTASLSCTLPIFLVVLSSTIAVGGFAAAIGQFLVYALGMGVVILSLTLAMTLFRSAVVGVFRKALPLVQPVSAAFMVVAGAYIIFYWLTIGDLA